VSWYVVYACERVEVEEEEEEAEEGVLYLAV